MKIKAQIDRMVGENNRIKAYASVILGGEYVVRDIAVMDSKNGLFARMPYRSYKDRNGDMKYSDTMFAMNETSRNHGKNRTGGHRHHYGRKERFPAPWDHHLERRPLPPR